jgi:hypothetical protein
MSVRIFFHRVSVFLLVFISLAPEAYCIKVRGLNIEEIATPHTAWEPESQPTGKHLDKLLENYPFKNAHIENDVEIKLTEDDNSTQGDNSQCTNTDLESYRRHGR